MTFATITQTYPPMGLDELVLRINSFSEMPLGKKRAFIEKLVAIHPALNLEWGSGHSFRRARRLQKDEIPETVDDVIWQKGVTAKLRRANPEGFQVLYVADRRDAALREARIDRDWAVIAEFEVRAGHSIFVCPIGEFRQIVRTGRGFLSGDASRAISQMLNACPLQEARSLVLTDAFLYEQMVGHDDYELSSIVAHSVFTKLSRVSAIAYSSRRQVGAINMAVKGRRLLERLGSHVG